MLTPALSPSTVAVLAAEGGFDIFDPNGLGNFVWTLLIFGLSLPLMWKFVFGPITVALLERDSKANEAVHAAREASEAAEKSRAEVEVALGNANAEAKKLIAAATQRAEVRERDIVEGAKKEAEAMIASARAQITAERDKAVAQIREEVVDLSLKAASQVVGRNVGSDDDKKLVQEIVASTGGGQ
ncbi:MAG: F0F1 ATP synthase subunit B [Planctomycetota bacterium]